MAHCEASRRRQIQRHADAKQRQRRGFDERPAARSSRFLAHFSSIFRTTKARNRLLLELMARGGMRVGEVLKLAAMDVEDQKLTIRNPKSGKVSEVVFIPKKLGDRLKDYIRARGIEGDQRIFPISYTAARVMVRKAGTLVGVHLKPHDLRRHAATYAFRSDVPVEIVSKVILRHANLSTTQRYLGKVSDVEAVRWIENLYG